MNWFIAQNYTFPASKYLNSIGTLIELIQLVDFLFSIEL